MQAIRQGYSIVVINKDILLNMFNEMFHKERVAADALRNAQFLCKSLHSKETRTRLLTNMLFNKTHISPHHLRPFITASAFCVVSSTIICD